MNGKFDTPEIRSAKIEADQSNEQLERSLDQLIGKMDDVLNRLDHSKDRLDHLKQRFDHLKDQVSEGAHKAEEIVDRVKVPIQQVRSNPTVQRIERNPSALVLALLFGGAAVFLLYRRGVIPRESVRELFAA